MNFQEIVVLSIYTVKRVTLTTFIGYLNLHQCDQGMLPTMFTWKFIKELLL